MYYAIIQIMQNTNTKTGLNLGLVTMHNIQYIVRKFFDHFYLYLIHAIQMQYNKEYLN